MQNVSILIKNKDIELYIFNEKIIFTLIYLLRSLTIIKLFTVLSKKKVFSKCYIPFKYSISIPVY